jgi:hypothetical protein
MKRISLSLLAFGLSWCSPLPASAQYIWIDLSIKAAVSAKDGTYPGGASLTNIQQQWDQAIARVNEHHAAFGRGYRYRRSGDVQSIGAKGDYNGPGKWSTLNIGDANNAITAAASDPTGYKWNNSALNIYCCEVPRSNSPPYGFGGQGAFFGCSKITPCGCPGEIAALVYQMQNWQEGWSVAHETGHFFGLVHTFASELPCSKTDVRFQTNGVWVGDDGFSSTLPEASDMTRNQLTIANFGKIYAFCNAAQQALADDTYFNLMSYHSGVNGEPRDQVTTRLTEEQLDQFANYASDPGRQRAVTSGATVFVDAQQGIDFLATGFSAQPFRTLAKAVAKANAAGGDIVLLRPAAYNERFTINKPVTLRVTRAGWATIGR